MRSLRIVSRPPRRVYRLARYVVHDWPRVTESYRFLAHSPRHVSSVLRETATTEPERIAEADGRTGMVRELMAAFLDATERVRREEAWGRFFAENAGQDDEGFAEASALEAGSRWREAH